MLSGNHLSTWEIWQITAAVYSIARVFPGTKAIDLTKAIDALVSSVAQTLSVLRLEL